MAHIWPHLTKYYVYVYTYIYNMKLLENHEPEKNGFMQKWKTEDSSR